MSRLPRTIMLLGSYGRGNIGDDALLAACLKLFINYRVIINASQDSILPVEAKSVIRVDTRLFAQLPKKIWAFLAADYIVYGGGDLWVELYGDRFPRQSLWLMVMLNMLGRLFGKHVFYFGCGAGDIKGFSLLLAQISARLASGVISREAATLKRLRIMGTTLPDLTCNVLPSGSRRSIGDRPVRTVGISLLYFIPAPEDNFPKLLDALAATVHTFDPETTQFVVLPMLTTPAVRRNDVWAAEQLKQRLAGYNVEISGATTYQEFIVALRSLDFMISTRLHGCILSTWSGIPTVGIAYRPKVSRFFSEYLHPDLVVDIDQMSKLPTVVQTALRQKETAEIFSRAAREARTGAQDYRMYVSENLS